MFNALGNIFFKKKKKKVGSNPYALAPILTQASDFQFLHFNEDKMSCSIIAIRLGVWFTYLFISFQ